MTERERQRQRQRDRQRQRQREVFRKEKRWVSNVGVVEICKTLKTLIVQTPTTR